MRRWLARRVALPFRAALALGCAVMVASACYTFQPAVTTPSLRTTLLVRFASPRVIRLGDAEQGSHELVYENVIALQGRVVALHGDTATIRISELLGAGGPFSLPDNGITTLQLPSADATMQTNRISGGRTSLVLAGLAVLIVAGSTANYGGSFHF